MKTAIMTLCICALAFGCDDASDEEGTGGTGGGQVTADAGAGGSTEEATVEQYIDEYATAFCGAIFGCCAEGALGLTTEDQCTGIFTDDTEDALAGISAGYMSYNPERVTGCLTDFTAILDDLGCTLYDYQAVSVPQSCRNVLTGQQAQGESCVTGNHQANFFCQEGLRCVGSDDTATCLRPGVDSAACDASSPCATGLICVSGMCEDAVGTPCGIDGPFCPDGLICDGESCFGGAVLDEPCGGSNPCGAGLACEGGVCAAVGLCE